MKTYWIHLKCGLINPSDRTFFYQEKGNVSKFTVVYNATNRVNDQEKGINNNVNVNICEIKSSLCNSHKTRLHLYLLYVILYEEFDKLN